MPTLQIQVDASSTLRELGRLADGPDVPDVLALSRVMYSQFAATQAAVAKATGSLFYSGKVETSYDDEDHTFHGGISYGGAVLRAAGIGLNGRPINNPVRYAKAVIGKNHNFYMDPVDELEPEYGQALRGFLSGPKGRR